MSLLSKIWSWFFPSVSIPISVGALIEKHDIQGLIRELKTAERGKDNGRENIPDSEASYPGDDEQFITNPLTYYMKKEKERVVRKLNYTKRRLRRIDFESRYQKINDEYGELKSDIEKEILTFKDKHEENKGRLQTVENGLKNFREEHDLNEDAHHSNITIGLFFAFSLIIAFAEFSINGIFFFAEGSKLGVLGGLLQALVISIINVGIGGVFGYFIFPQINHKHMVHQALAITGMLIYLTLVFSLNVTVMHYREAFMIDPDSATVKIIMPTLLENPFGINDIKSWLLLALGVVCSFIAAFKWYKRDDPYPGYSKRWRRHDRVRNELADQHEKFLDKVERAKKKSDRYLEDQKNKIKSERGAIDDELEEKDDDCRYFSELKARVESMGKDLIQSYRESNRNSRKTDPPEFFYDQNWQIDLDDPEPDFSGFDKDKKHAEYECVVEKIEELKKQLDAFYSKEVGEIRRWEAR